MRFKILVVFAVFFCAQVIISCCDCEEAGTYEYTYTNVSVTPYDNSGFYPIMATDTVYKNAFGLGVNLFWDEQKYASNNHLNFGFDNALAFECDCIFDDYFYSDSLDYIKLYTIDLCNGERTDVTTCFEIYTYSGEFLSIEEFFDQKEEFYDNIELKLTNYKIIPNSVIFEVEAILESSNSMISQTDIVNFYEE